MKQKALSVMFVMTLVLCLYGCGRTVPPKLGHYEGTNPNVSFNVTAAGIENFTITVPFGAGFGVTTCTLGPLDTLNIKSDGSFSYHIDSKSNVSITGKISGDTVNGNFSFLLCMEGGQLSILNNPSEGKWSAGSNGKSGQAQPAITPTQVPVKFSPPKLGHYEGTNPIVSFDIVEEPSGRGMEAGLVNLNFTVVVGNSTCTIGPISETYGVVGEGEFNVQFQFQGTINGDNATGNYFTNCGNGLWTANWVSP